MVKIKRWKIYIKFQGLYKNYLFNHDKKIKKNSKQNMIIKKKK
jgi:hypothetical protein